MESTKRQFSFLCHNLSYYGQITCMNAFFPFVCLQVFLSIYGITLIRHKKYVDTFSLKQQISDQIHLI